MYKNILVPTDGSPLSRASAQKAVVLAKAIGARITALFAAPKPEFTAGVATIDITPAGSIWMSGYAARTKASDRSLIAALGRRDRRPSLSASHKSKTHRRHADR